MNSQPDLRMTITTLKRDLLASVVVFLVALPLCMGIAIASGAPPAAGLITGILGGLLVGALAGAPLQVSGPAAGLTVIVYDVIQKHGIEMLGVIVLLAGAMQVVAGLLKLGQIFRAASPAVMEGMLCGIGILIFAGQFHVMVDDKPASSGIRNLITLPVAVAKGFPLTEMAPKEFYRSRTRWIKEVLTIHLSQVELSESVAHVVSHQAPGSEEVAASLRQLAADQEAITNRLNQLAVDTAPQEMRDAAQASANALTALRAGDAAAAREGQQETELQLVTILDNLKSHRWAAGLGVMTIVVLLAWQSLGPQKLKLIPGALLGVTAATAAAAFFDLPVLFVEVPSDLREAIFLPTAAEFRGLFEPTVWMSSAVIAIVASAESLLCAGASDLMHHGPRTRYDKELAAQGIGNVCCGLLGGLPMTGVIVRSAANIRAGAQTRLSAMLHGLWLLIFVVSLPVVLRMIPTSSLAAILVYTGWRLVNFKAMKRLWETERGEAIIFAVTATTIVVQDLLTGVAVGIVLSLVQLIYTFARLEIRTDQPFAEGQTRLRLKGVACFLQLPKLARALEQLTPGCEVVIDAADLRYIDHACYECLRNWREQHESNGGRVIIDWYAFPLSQHSHRSAS